VSVGRPENPVKKTKPSVEQFLPLTPAAFQILVVLADGERHGYAIMREVTTRTLGGMRLGPGTLYGAISRLLADGLIEEGGEQVDPELGESRRRYYRLTTLGRRVAVAQARHLSELVRLARSKRLIGEEAV
jgi:DNA-binding PadR family transcriptional regulator